MCVADNRVAVNCFAVCVCGGLGVDYSLHNAHIRAMYLPATSQRPMAWEKLEKAPPILQNVFRRVFVKAREVQRTLGHGADTAASGRETIGEAGVFQRRTDQRADAVVLAPVEAGVF